MNREAVALGTPVFTTFTGRMGGVDEALIAEGRLQVLADPAALRAAQARLAGRRPPSARPRRPGRGRARRRRRTSSSLIRPALRSGQKRNGPRRPPTPSSPSSPPRRSPGCWSPTPSGSPSGSARSTCRSRAACTTSRCRASPAWRSWSRSRPPAGSGCPGDGQSHAILLGAVAIAAVGVVDDVRGLPALPKLLGQIAAALIPVLAGVRVDNLTLPFVGGFELGWLAYPLTVLGIVAVVNVINFLDGVDGLAAGVCTIAAITLAAIALSLERNAAGVLAALTAGAALGFLRHGFPPASSFMGDTGSNLLGYLLATASVQGALKTNAVIALAFPLIVLAVPILDTGFVVAKRLKYRQPIYQADSWHFHHRMANIGFSQRRTVAYLYAWTLVMAALALALRFVPYSDNHGHFDALWTVVMGACCCSRSPPASTCLRAGDPQAAPRPDQSGDRRIRGDRPGAARRGSGNPHEVASQSHSRGLFGYSRQSARSPEPGVSYVSSQVRRPTRAGRRPRSVSAGRAAHARLRGGRRRLADPARDPDVRRQPRRRRARRRQPPAGDGDRRRDHPRPGLADGDRGAPGRPRRTRRPASPPRSSSSSSSRSPSPPRAWPTSSASRGPEGDERSGDVEAPKSAVQSQGLIGIGVYLGIAILMLLIFGSSGKDESFKPQNEFKLEPWVSIHLAGIDLSINKAVLYLRPRQRPDDLHDGLDLPPHAPEAEPGADRDRGRLRHDQEHDHRRQPRRRRWPPAGSRSWPRSSSGSGSRT